MVTASRRHCLLYIAWTAPRWTENVKSGPSDVTGLSHDICCALCVGVIDWHNCGTILGVLECGLGLFWCILYSLCTLFVEMGPCTCPKKQGSFFLKAHSEKFKFNLKCPRRIKKSRMFQNEVRVSLPLKMSI